LDYAGQFLLELYLEIIASATGRAAQSGFWKTGTPRRHLKQGWAPPAKRAIAKNSGCAARV